MIKIVKNLKKARIKTALILSLFLLSLLPVYGFACNNGPNYWGNGYPGYPPPSTELRYSHPNKPSEYLVANTTFINSQGYDGSHYGTHDWIADAALRSLRDPLKNPLGYNDWTWLINKDIARNKWLKWNDLYGNDALHHNKIRSYFTFLFATQMPDMDKKTHPKEIRILEEGVIIRNFENCKWVGYTEDHSFHFLPIKISEGMFKFSPYKTSSAIKARELGEKAIQCIGNRVKNKDETIRSAMQPEGAAGWLGAMTHFIADMVIPAHLLQQSLYSDIFSVAYHNWFENQLGSLTKWDKGYKANGGPNTDYFSWDISNIGMTGEWTGFIIPIRPDFAITSMAWHAIEIAFRSDGNHQHLEWDGQNNYLSLNSGLYLDKKEEHWNWEEDLKNNGRNGSPHKYFYDKVEELLCWATFFTACAMQYCLNEGKKKAENTQGLNPDYWVNRDPNELPRYPPDPDPQRNLDEFLGDIESFTDRFSKILRNIGLFLSPIIISIASMIGRMFYRIGR